MLPGISITGRQDLKSEGKTQGMGKGPEVLRHYGTKRTTFRTGMLNLTRVLQDKGGKTHKGGNGRYFKDLCTTTDEKLSVLNWKQTAQIHSKLQEENMSDLEDGPIFAV